MDVEQLKEILHRHALWINNPEEGCRAVLSEADLHRAILRGAKFTWELKDAVNLHTAVYDPCQFPFLALNHSFLESV